MSDTQKPADVKTITKALSAPFETTEVKFKPQMVKNNRAMALAYVDARVIQDRLDEVLGVEGWQDEYFPREDGSVVCKLQLKLGGEWVTKMDVGSPSEQPDGGDRLKAAFSDALKRAAVKFGVGRYLYRLPQQWCDYDSQKRTFVRTPSLPDYALPAKSAQPAPATKPAKPARPAAEKPATLPAKAHRPGAPADGRELQQRLQDYDAKLAAQGLCPKGALLAHVTQAGVKGGFGADLSSWGGAAIALAVDETKAYEAHLRRPAAEQKAVA